MEDLTWLVILSVVMFSNCNFDACYINWFSSEGGCVPLSPLYNEEIFEYYLRLLMLTDFLFFNSTWFKRCYTKKNWKCH